MYLPQQKTTPGDCHLRGPFFARAGLLSLLLSVSIKPLADVVTHNTCSDRDNKASKQYHILTPF